MKQLFLFSLLALNAAAAARNVTIIRDTWGIAHVYGKTDADAVFGMIYTQAEDDFNRVENNYLLSMGRSAEAEGESKIYQDLRMKLFIDPAELKRQYAASPAWLRKLMDAFADGLNYYLAKHPAVKPRVIKHWEPWMALSFTEGSIGGDIEQIRLPALEAFYGKTTPKEIAANILPADEEPRGSNGIAIAPSHSVSHNSLLLINPHTSFFFRSELQMVSGQGLNAYGAVTWGQFFIYQGFNDRAGWMHTSSKVDSIDEYLETVTQKNGHYFYKYGDGQRPVIETVIAIPYRTATGMAEKKFTTYRTHHGPVIREANGKWVSYRIMQENIKALQQSYLRTKARNYKEYWKTMELMANSSNNTIYADADGTIAYFHGNYIPRRDTRFDWKKPVDGSIEATEWKGLHTVEESPHLLNPKSGWLFNVNNWPWAGAGESSLKQSDFPAYVDNGVESARGLHAIRVLDGKPAFTLESLLAAAFDTYLPWFDKPLPALFRAYDQTPNPKLAQQIELLRNWDHRWAVDSIPTSLAVFWATEMQRKVTEPAGAAEMPASFLLDSLAAASQRLQNDFGKWQTPWGEINRFQRLTGDIVQTFNDAGASIPVGFPSAVWGSLASFGARPYPGTKKWYGTSGNSFVAVVEFGKKVRAVAVTAGGESGDPKSPHFNDQANRYSTGNLREVFFYRDQVDAHTERRYKP